MVEVTLWIENANSEGGSDKTHFSGYYETKAQFLKKMSELWDKHEHKPTEKVIWIK